MQWRRWAYGDTSGDKMVLFQNVQTRFSKLPTLCSIYWISHHSNRGKRVSKRKTKNKTDTTYFVRHSFIRIRFHILVRGDATDNGTEWKIWDPLSNSICSRYVNLTENTVQKNMYTSHLCRKKKKIIAILPILVNLIFTRKENNYPFNSKYASDFKMYIVLISRKKFN